MNCFIFYKKKFSTHNHKSTLTGVYGPGKSGKLPDLLLYPENPGFFRYVSAFRLTKSKQF